MIGPLLDEIIAGAFIAIVAFIFRFVGAWGILNPLSFWRGWVDEDRGVSECPYPLGSMKANAWGRGWAKSREQLPGRNADDDAIR